MALADEPLPRSGVTITKLTASVTQRTTRTGRWLSWAFLGTMLVVAALVAIRPVLAEHHTSEDVEDGLTLAVLFVVFMGILPGLAIRRILRRDLRSVPELVRDGVAYPATVVRRDRLVYGGAKQVTLQWKEGGQAAAARFHVDQLDVTSDRVVVLARTGQRTVGLVVDEALFLGRRSAPLPG